MYSSNKLYNSASEFVPVSVPYRFPFYLPYRFFTASATVTVPFFYRERDRYRTVLQSFAPRTVTHQFLYGAVRGPQI